jgi:hypothetical protein
MKIAETISGVEFAHLDRPALEGLRIGADALVDIFRGGGAGTVVQAGRRTLVRRCAVGSREIYFKLYRNTGVFRWFQARRLFSRAFQAFRNSCRVADAGIGTAPILAVVIRDRTGRSGESGLFTLSLSPAQSITLFFLDPLPKHGAEENRRLALGGLSDFLFRIHQQGIYPRDFKDTNVLVRRDEHGTSLYLVDCDSISFLRAVSLKKRVKNLWQIGITLGEALTREERLFFLSRYCQRLGGRQVEVHKLEQAIADVILKRQQKIHRLPILRAKGL